MQSDSLHILCKRLADTNDRISLALDNADASALAALAAEHRRIVQDMVSKGECRDTGMIGIFKELRDQVLDLGRSIKEQRDDLRAQLLMAERKKQAAAVYTDNTFRLQPGKPSFPAART